MIIQADDDRGYVVDRGPVDAQHPDGPGRSREDIRVSFPSG